VDPAFPLTRLVLRADSVAQDLAFVGLRDVEELFFRVQDPQAVLIGAQMVTLHAYRWGLGAELYRESRDADTGVTTVGLRDGTLLPRIEQLGYARMSGNTFEKPVPDIPGGSDAVPSTAQIELLAPAFTSRPRENVQLGAFVVTEVPGLATAMKRTVTVHLRLTRLNGESSDIAVVLPDEAGCLVLRAHAWQKRLQDRDAIDVWRALEIASRAGLGPTAFAGPARAAAQIVRDSFAGLTSPGVTAVMAGRTLVPSAPKAARVVALARAVVGSVG
jgi:hypothetical protein